MRVAGVLPEGEAVGEILLELIAEHLLFARKLVDVGIADEQFGRDTAERRVDDRSRIGQEVDAAGIGLRGGRQHGEGGVRVRLVGDGRRNEIIVVGCEIDLGAAVLDLADDAVEQLPVSGGGRDRAADIERQIGIAEIVDAGLDVADRLRRRHLADRVDDAARAGTAIQHGRGTAQHFDAGEVERRQLPAGIGRIEELEAVEEQADIVGLEAADQEPVVAGVGAKRAGDRRPACSARSRRTCRASGRGSVRCRSPTGIAASA